MYTKLVTLTWLCDHPTKTNSYKELHFFVFTHLWSKEPCSLFSSQRTQSRQRLWFNIFFFSAITVNFLCSSTMADGTANDEVSTVTIKVPLFFKYAPETWFAHLENQFNIKKITISSTKFYWCISALPSNVSAQLTQMIWDPGEDSYQDIKDHLIHLYSLSNY